MTKFNAPNLYLITIILGLIAGAYAPIWAYFHISYLIIFFILSLISYIIVFGIKKISFLYHIVCFLISFCAIILFIKDSISDKVKQKETLSFIGNVVNISENKTNNLTIKSIDGKKYYLSWFEPKNELKINQKYLFGAVVKPAISIQNPNTFDFEKFLFTKDIDGIGYITSAILLEDVPNTEKFDLKGNLLKAYPNLNHLFLALGSGDSSLLTKDEWSAFNELGITHMLIVSGAHISLVFLLFFSITRLILTRFFKIHAWGIPAFLGFAITILYANLVGLEVSVIRSVLMLFLGLVAELLLLNVNRWSVFWLGMLTTIIINPFFLYSNGFWLSFTAVFVLFNNITKLSSKSLLEKIGLLFKIQIFIFIALSPLLLIMYGQISLISPIVNFLLIPVISLLTFAIVPLVLMFIIAPTTIAYSTFIIHIISSALDAVMGVILSLHQLNIPLFAKLEKVEFLFLFVIGILISIDNIPYKKLLVFLYITFFVIFNTKKEEEIILKATIFDVGQGQSIYINIKNKNILFDTGWGDSSPSKITEILQNNLNQVIDVFILSENGKDHKGNRQYIKENFSVLNEIYDYHDMKDFEIYGLKFDFLHPDDKAYDTFSKKHANNLAKVLLISHATGSILIPSDIEARAEKHIVKNTTAHPVDVMIAPHHGSKSSSTEELLKHFSPKNIIISAERYSRYGNPHSIVLDRYKKFGINHLITSNSGAIEVLFRKKGLEIRKFRESLPFIYNNFFHLFEK